LGPWDNTSEKVALKMRMAAWAILEPWDTVLIALELILLK